jgi:thiol:disulfide interchange protein
MTCQHFEEGPVMVTTGRRGWAPLLLLTVVIMLALNGCVTVRGTGVPRRAVGSNDTLGLARPFLPLPVVALAPVPDGYDANADAEAAVTAALAASHRDGKPVLLDFGSSWCEDCQALSTLIGNTGVHRILARNYHLVTVDVGHFDHNTALAARYVTLSRSGIPALVLLGPDGAARGTGDNQVADARNIGADQIGDMLVDWLYLGN